MSKEKQLYEILRALQKGEIGTDLAHLQILRLFSVVGRSEQFTCSCGIPPAIRLCEGVESCLKCGKKLSK
jgi:hypothetical protein